MTDEGHAAHDAFPRRIVCLTTETVETLYLLGQQHRIAGISGFTVRPPQARKEKPRIAAFTSAKLDKILELNPDLVLGFSNLQADIAAGLIREGLQVHVFNQRMVSGILEMIQTLGALVGAREKAATLIERLSAGIETVRRHAQALPRRPRVYFEEWNEPLISGIGWVSELIGIAGGVDCFADLASASDARERTIHDPQEVVRRQPDIIVGSWCGKKFQPKQVAQRPGWAEIPAIRHGHVYEIKSADILSPGPAALDDGLRQLHEIVAHWAADATP